MNDILVITLPFFALVVIGFFAARRGAIEAQGVIGLNRFVYFFALPALLFDKMSTAPFDHIISQSPFLLAHTIAGLIVFSTAWLVARVALKTDGGETAIVSLSAAYGNIGFMGIALLVGAVGEWTAVPLALMLLIDIAFFIPLATVIIDIKRNGGNVGGLVSALVASVVKNPLIISIVLGVFLAATNVELPGAALRLVDLLGRTAGPCAMFALGAVLAGRPLKITIGDGIKTAAVISVFKLGVHPAVMWVAMTAFGVSAEWRLAATLGAAMPAAAAIFVIAQEYKTMPVRASTGVLVSTAISMVTLTALVWILAGD